MKLPTMFQHICVPVDLSHTETLQKALTMASDLSRLYTAKVTLMAVTSTAPSDVAHNPEEFASKLSAFALEQGEANKVTFETLPLSSHDPAVDLEKTLDQAIHENGVDLVVTASHVPSLADYVFRSHSSYLAKHTDISVVIVR